MAYGELGLTSLHGITLPKFRKLVKGHQDRTRLAQEQMVEQAAILLSPHSKRGVKPSQILNRPTVHEIRNVKRKSRAKRQRGEA